jgi:putative oxidoreductase
MSLKELLFGGAEIGTPFANLGLLLLRVYAGLTLASQHGVRKIPPSERFIQGVSEIGLPLPELFSWAAGCAEFFGGTLLVIGLLTRPAAFFILITMLTAVFGRHAGDPFSNKELALTYGLIAVTFLLLGSGRYGIDRLLQSRKRDYTE